MLNLESVLCLAPLVLLSIHGCGLSHGIEAGPATDVMLDAGAEPDDAGPSDAGPSDAYCGSLCAMQTVTCETEFGRWSWGSTCEERCASLSGSSPATQAAFEHCVLTEPLCYEDLAGCVLRYRYPEPVRMPMSVGGMGFEEHEGRTVEVWRREGGEFRSRRTRIVGGGFELRWTEVLLPNSAAPFGTMIHIDVDEDGVCDPEIDVAEDLFFSLTGSFDALEYSATLEGPSGRALSGTFSRICTR